jgi:hypothetical protein
VIAALIFTIRPGTRREGHTQNEDLKSGMEVFVEYNGAWQKAKVIGPVTLITGRVTEITGWKLHVGPSALDLILTADKIFPRAGRQFV